jgi:hypothetical protein
MGVSIRAKRRNTDIRKLSGHTVTLIEKIQQQRLSWCGHTERWNKSWQNRVGQGWATRRVRGAPAPPGPPVAPPLLLIQETANSCKLILSEQFSEERVNCCLVPIDIAFKFETAYMQVIFLQKKIEN